MNRNMALLVLLMLQFLITRAQVSKESFEKSVDLINCRSVELTFKTQKEKLSNFKEQCPCGETKFIQIRQYLDSTGNLDATIALSKEIDGLKQTFKENWKNEEVISFLTEDVFIDKVNYPKINAFAEKRRTMPEFTSYITGIKADLPNNLVDVVSSPKAPISNVGTQPPVMDDRKRIPEVYVSETKGTNGFLGVYSDYFTILSIFLGITALIIALSRPSAKKMYPFIRDKLIRSKTMNEFFQQKNTNFETTFQTNATSLNLDNRISAIEAKLNNLKTSFQNPGASAVETSSQLYPKTKQQIHEISQPIHKENAKQERTEIIYFSSPNSDGSFDENSASTVYKEGATIYQFTKIDSRRALFKIAEKEASIKLALQLRDKRIDPACVSTNAFNQAKGLTILKQGEAELENGKWTVLKKASLRYEN